MTDKSNASKNTANSIESLSDMVNELPVRAEELKAKFAAGAVPLEGDYVKLIDAIYSALTALGLDPDNRATGDGLQVNTETGKLEVKTSGAVSGLTVTTNGIAVDKTVIQPKLTPDANKGYIKIDGNNTIGIDSLDFGITSSKWINVVGKGVNTQSINKQHLMVHGEQFTLNESSGYNCIELKLKPSGGIKTHADGLEIDTSVIQPKLTAGEGITITGNTISNSQNENFIRSMAAMYGATYFSENIHYVALYTTAIFVGGNYTRRIYLAIKLGNVESNARNTPRLLDVYGDGHITIDERPNKISTEDSTNGMSGIVRFGTDVSFDLDQKTAKIKTIYSNGSIIESSSTIHRI